RSKRCREFISRFDRVYYGLGPPRRRVIEIASNEINVRMEKAFHNIFNSRAMYKAGSYVQTGNSETPALEEKFKKGIRQLIRNKRRY
ncbi:hypothetical protein ACOME3_010639, partial [Neoechinorhynchus agilis]